MASLRALAVAAVTIAATARGVAAQHDLVTLPLGDPAYRQLEALDRLGCVPARISPYRPYAVGLVRTAVGEMSRDARCAASLVAALEQRFGPSPHADTTSSIDVGGEVQLRAMALRNGDFGPLWRDVQSTSSGTPPLVAVGRGRATWNASPGIVVVTEVYAQSNVRNDPRTRGAPLRESDAVLDFSEAYASGRAGPLTASFGRSWEAWLGRGAEGLSLGAHGPAIDRLSVVARWSRWEGRALLAALDRVTLDPALDGPTVEEPVTVHRMLAAHAVTYRPSERVELTLGETVLIGRRSPTPDLAYANPLMIYLVTEHDQDREFDGNHNNIVAFGAARIGLGSAIVEAELHVDDIQIDRVDRERIPDQLAWRVAGSLPVATPVPVILGAEYRRIDSYTYLRRSYNAVYQRYHAPIGSELGPDADLVRAEAESWLSGTTRIAASLGRWRRGAQRIDFRPSPAAEGHAGERFPSATDDRPAVQQGWLLDLSFEYLGSRLPFGVRAEVANLENVNNRPENPATYARVSFVGTYRFRYP